MTDDTIRLTVHAWWSPAAQAWRIEDGEMYTYTTLDALVEHLRAHEVSEILVDLRWPRADELERALRAAGVSIVRSSI